MKKKEYTAPTLTVVEFKMEKGYALSMLRITSDHEVQSSFNDYGQENWQEESGSLFDNW